MIIKTILQAFKPFYLVSLIATYLMGAGLVQYVRGMKSISIFIEGLLFLILITISTQLIVLSEKLKDREYWIEGINEDQIRQLRWIIPMIAATLLTVALTIFVGWILSGLLYLAISVLLAVIVVSCVGCYLAEVKPALKSILLFLETIHYLILPPALAYFLQSSENHSFLIMTVTCSVPVFLAYGLLGQIREIGFDHKKGHQTLVFQVGWEKAMVFHNALILMSYLLFALMALIGFPWFFVWPVFLTLPIGLVSIWLFEQMRRGKKPLWRLMQLSDAVVYFFPIYFIGIAFWIR